MKKLSRLLPITAITVASLSAFAQAGDQPAAVDKALQLIQQNPAAFSVAVSGTARTLKFAGPQAAAPTDGDQFQVRDVIVDPDGTEHVRFDRFHAGLPVIGGDVVVHSSKGQLKQASVTQLAPINLAGTVGKVGNRAVVRNAPDVGATRARHIAAARFNSDVRRVEDAELVVFARDVTPTLAYAVRVYGKATDTHGDAVLYYVDARTGTVLDAQDLIKTAAATGTGRSLYYGNLTLTTDQTGTNAYRMLDPGRGGGSVYDGRGLSSDEVEQATDLPIFTSSTNVWGNNTTTDRQTVAADIDYGLALTWDYYKTTHNRNGIFNDGRGVKSYAHVVFNTGSGTTGANAAWLSSRVMAYGDGEPGTRLPKPVVSVDVAGHEMSHGVTEATANLNYSGDAGGLNESTSDIFGTLVKFYANNPNDPGNYVIGARVVSGGLRKMYKQDLDGRSFSCYPSGGFSWSNPRHDPHFSSGVGNRFFYLLSEGPSVPSTDTGLSRAQLVCNGDTTFSGLGRDKAGKIWYRTLTVYLNANSSYPNARRASIQAANDLYGANSAESATVARAWSAVGVN
ncbi:MULTISPECIES: M4 family metallopeptidase [Burkholderia]|uniref:M4 family metallopeptidase n=1 Tax=Burkholderia TaxID=32008 RepID=UPI0003C42CE6|nr:MULTISPECIES: M4 family metallopeptidase [Burkholderia]ESS38794.1 Bacillolysin precursor [Burkholderia cenocepacia KC-01]MBL3961985.1 M4 family metallopeptidase [Burkholderia sp. KCJ3K979]MBR8306613.1 M4 family metallopeptidase [Burkholderia cenocepacia]QND98465.1 transglutaminase-activating metalloprotease precursor [Burkholderia cenocepacia]RQU77561.1 M4 family peptidase [Burkholderia cenocepacia]